MTSTTEQEAQLWRERSALVRTLKELEAAPSAAEAAADFTARLQRTGTDPLLVGPKESGAAGSEWRRQEGKSQSTLCGLCGGGGGDVE